MTTVGTPEIHVVPMGASAFIAAFTREIGFSQVINDHVAWDEKQWKRSPGLLAEAMLINILTSRTPLYHVQPFFAALDTQVLFGPGISAADFNDDALGRMLDRLAETDCHRLFSNLVLRAALKHHLTFDSLHGDTTSISVYGEYPDATPETLNIARGYNKDGRFDCKQILAGLVVNQDGVPVMGSIDDGNLNDVVWNQRIIEHLPVMQEALNAGQTPYVADSKLITSENLERMAKGRLSFLSRLPHTFSLADELKAEAFARGQWQEVGKLSSKKDAAVYRLQSFVRPLGGRMYRFVVVHSSSLDQRKAKALEKDAEQQRKELEKICQELGRQTFSCEPDARKALEQAKKRHSKPFYSLEGQVAALTQVQRKRGRPKKGEVLPEETVYRLDVRCGPRHEEAWAMAKAHASTFVLITSVVEQEKFTDVEALQLYKNQNTVEMRFRFLKDPAILDGVFVQKPQRVKALGYLFLMALLVFALIERRVRKRLAEKKEFLQLGYRPKVDRPTGMLILEQFKHMAIIHIRMDSRLHRQLPGNIPAVVRQILSLCGFDPTIYSGGLQGTG